MFLSEKKYPEILLDEILGSDKYTLTDEMVQSLENIIDMLPELDKRLICFRYKEKMILSDIADRIGYSSSYCGSKLQLAVCRLKHSVAIDTVLGSKLQNIPKETYIPKYLVEKFDFDSRTYNLLKRAGINSLEQITSVNQLLTIKGIGKKTVKMIEEALLAKGLSITYGCK